jgi:hypothetical protein
MDKILLTFDALSCFGGGWGGVLCGLKIFMHQALTGCMYLACLACSAGGITSFDVMYILLRQQANFHQTCNHKKNKKIRTPSRVRPSFLEISPSNKILRKKWRSL